MGANARRGVMVGFGLLAIILSTVDAAYATAANVPEIDGGSIAAGLGLLAAGALMLRARSAK